MKRIVIWLFAALAIAVPPAAALAHEHESDDATQVLVVVEAFMAGLEAKDADAMTALVTEDSYLALVEEREGEDRTQSMSLVQAAQGLAAVPADIAEPIFDPVVMVEGPVAMVWAPYEFILDGTRTHCGIDIFTLMRVDGDWKVATVTYSHVEEGCPDRA